MVDNTTELDQDNTFVREALQVEIGIKLQQKREAKDLSQAQVIKELKFSPLFLEALESGDWSNMPGEIYALGFLRQYAGLLGLDVRDDIERIKTNAYELTTPLTYPDAPISPNRTWVIVAVLLFILMILVTNLFVGDEADSLPPTDHVQSNAITPPQGEVVAKPDRGNLVSKMGAQKDLSKKTHQEATSVAVKQGDVTNNTAISQVKSYVFSAVSDDVWLQVFEKKLGSDKINLRREALLKMGQSFKLKSGAQLMLTAGKPTALEINIDGETVYQQGKLGQKGKILKMFPL